MGGFIRHLLFLVGQIVEVSGSRRGVYGLDPRYFQNSLGASSIEAFS